MAIFLVLCVLLNMFSLYMYASKTDINSILNVSESPITLITMIALSCLLFVIMGSKDGFHQVGLYEDFGYIKKLYKKAIDKKVPVDSILNREIYLNYSIGLVSLIIDSLLFPMFYLVSLSVILYDSMVYANMFFIIGIILFVVKLIRIFIDKKLEKWFDESMKWRRLVASQVEN